MNAGYFVFFDSVPDAAGNCKFSKQMSHCDIKNTNGIYRYYSSIQEERLTEKLPSEGYRNSKTVEWNYEPIYFVFEKRVS